MAVGKTGGKKRARTGTDENKADYIYVRARSGQPSPAREGLTKERHERDGDRELVCCEGRPAGLGLSGGGTPSSRNERTPVPGRMIGWKDGTHSGTALTVQRRNGGRRAVRVQPVSTSDGANSGDAFASATSGGRPVGYIRASRRQASPGLSEHEGGWIHRPHFGEQASSPATPHTRRLAIEASGMQCKLEWPAGSRAPHWCISPTAQKAAAPLPRTLLDLQVRDRQKTQPPDHEGRPQTTQLLCVKLLRLPFMRRMENPAGQCLVANYLTERCGNILLTACLHLALRWGTLSPMRWRPCNPRSTSNGMRRCGVAQWGMPTLAWAC